MADREGRVSTSRAIIQMSSESEPPDPATCPQCGKSFPPKPIKVFEGVLWCFPGFDRDNQLCEICLDVLRQEEREKEEIRRREERRENIATYLKTLQAEKYFTATFDSFRPPNRELEAALKRCREYAANPIGGLYLYGPYGAGKTHLAAAITREVILQDRLAVEFVFVPKMLMKIRMGFDEVGRSTEYEQVSHYSEKVSFLVMDDIGVEKATDWARQTLDVISYERDAHGLATVITSNLSPDEIAKKIDPRIASQLAGLGKIIRVIGPDYRGPKNSFGNAGVKSLDPSIIDGSF